MRTNPIPPPARWSARFWASVTPGKPDECWEWQGPRELKWGYGRLKIGRIPFGAHRLSWFLMYEQSPDGLCVLHRCDNPPCVNPAHLFLGTRTDNCSDMRAKGRWHQKPTPGSIHGHALLVEADIVEIRARIAAGESKQTLAEEFGVQREQIRRIIKRNRWSHVP